MQFDPPDGYRNIARFPTTPASEADFRDSMQSLLDQLLYELNHGGSSAVGIYAMARQAVINGNFSVNQRVVSGVVTLAAGQYGHDRWKAGSGGCSYTFATVNGVTTITITAGSLVQVIEGINLVSGTYTLSWIGTAQGKIGAGVFGDSGITGAATGGANLSIEFNVGTLSKVQFNIGDQALPFQPRIFSQELALCQRYFEKSFRIDIAPVQNAGGAVGPLAYRKNVAGAGGSGAFVNYKVTKRVAPTITFYNPSAANANWRNNTATADSGTASAAFVSDNGFFANNTGQASETGTADSCSVHWTADAEL